MKERLATDKTAFRTESGHGLSEKCAAFAVHEDLKGVEKMENEKEYNPDARVRVAFVVVMRNGDWREVEDFLQSRVERIQYVKKCPTSIRLVVNEVIRNKEDLKEEKKNDKWNFRA